MADTDTTPEAKTEIVPEDSLQIEQLDEVAGGMAEAAIRPEID